MNQKMQIETAAPFYGQPLLTNGEIIYKKLYKILAACALVAFDNGANDVAETPFIMPAAFNSATASFA